MLSGSTDNILMTTYGLALTFFLPYVFNRSGYRQVVCLVSGAMPSGHIVTTLFRLFSQMLHMAFLWMVSLAHNNNLLWGHDMTGDKRLQRKSTNRWITNTNQSLEGKVWVCGNKENSWSLACGWLMLCLTVCGDRDSHNALQTTVWRLNFLQPQSPKPSASSGSLLWWCLLAERGSYVTINSVALVINYRLWLSWTSLFHFK